MKKVFIELAERAYKLIARPVLFLFDSEKIHRASVRAGELIGNANPARMLVQTMWKINSPALEQNICGIRFKNPIGLSAGFDYEARLTKILPAIGFGFGTIGTITNQPCDGNPPPRLGRLIKSKSLLVNKGFRNPGIKNILAKHAKSSFCLPIGLSIGKTNSRETMTQKEAVTDITQAFATAENSSAPFCYYELNISCPNLFGNVEFYSPQHLQELLSAIKELKIKKPLFIKMPIEKNNEEILSMLKIIASFPVSGVIFGNLLKNRGDSSLEPEEVKRCAAGNFSGKPTEKRSNELIRLAYKNYGGKFVIIGCGGVFGPENAYKKIRLGASLVELITGLIYVGPQLPAQINLGLLKLMERDGFTNISQSIGVDA